MIEIDTITDEGSRPSSVTTITDEGSRPSSVTAITDEGSRRLPKCLKFVTLLASVYEPQSCQNYLATQDYSN